MKLDDDTEMYTVTLRFRDRILDYLFQHDFYEKTISQLRWNVLLGAFLYGELGTIDYLIIHNLRHEAWFIPSYVSFGCWCGITEAIKHINGRG